jgi:hypothetical protein
MVRVSYHVFEKLEAAIDFVEIFVGHTLNSKKI